MKETTKKRDHKERIRARRNEKLKRKKEKERDIEDITFNAKKCLT
jgi:hypothetical protein